VASDINGVSGRAMLEAMIAGQRDPAVLADLAKRRLRVKIPALICRWVLSRGQGEAAPGMGSRAPLL
jgi:hypothetical protein